MSDEHLKRWQAAAHAMQSGVAMEMHHTPAPTEPKHLRVGINTALTDHGALVRLLIAKGVFTIEEYEEAIADGMEEEQKRYEDMLSGLVGEKVTLR